MQCKSPSSTPIPKCFLHGTLDGGTPLAKQSKPAIFHIPPPSLKKKFSIQLEIAQQNGGFHIRTESEIQKQQILQEMDAFLRETLPAVFPTYINCQTLAWDECVWQEGCSWCNWPKEGCQYTDVSYLLPTTERCIDGGVPFHPDQLPERLCGDIWFEAC